jgi:cytochrome c55X
MKVASKALVKTVVGIGMLTASMISSAATDDPQPSVAQGSRLYTSYCARCHGLNMASNGATFDLRTFPKDQRERFERSVTKGLRAMPAWGSTLKPDEVEALWLYVSSGGGS